MHDNIQLNGSFYVDLSNEKMHAHAMHSHHGVLELLYVYSGEGRYQVGGREYAVSEGDMIICNAKVLHGETLSLVNTIQTYCIALHGVKLDGLPEGHLIPEKRRPVVGLGKYKDAVSALMPAIHRAFLAQEYETAWPMAVSVLMMTCRELETQENDARSEQIQRSETLVRKIIGFIDERYMEALRIEELCKQFHLSRTYLSAMFKRETGLSPKQYIILRKIGEAQSRLSETNEPIADIEESLGFGSSCHFSSTFKKYVGISPREYRKSFE